MRMFYWKPEMIRYMIDASEHSDYHGRLAAKIAAELPSGADVCDAGCGLGYLSLALAPYCRSVTAVDLSEDALAVLRRKQGVQGADNITIRCGELSGLPPQKPYDAMVFCFFGETEQILDVARRQCCGKVIIIKKNWEEHRFTLSRKKMEHETFTIVQQKLTARRIPFRAEALEMEMGQPLHSVEDGVAFFRTYSHDEDPSTITAEAVKDKLVATGLSDFPYYLPQKKRMGYLVLNTADLPAGE